MAFSCKRCNQEVGAEFLSKIDEDDLVEEAPSMEDLGLDETSEEEKAEESESDEGKEDGQEEGKPGPADKVGDSQQGSD